MKPIAREILRFLFQNPAGEFAYRELERKTGLSIGTVSTYVGELAKEGLIKTRKSSNSILVKANLDNPLFIHLKRAYNIEVLYSSGLVEHLAYSLRPDAMVVFGSYSRGEDDEKSDIDIAIIHGRETISDVRRFEKILERKINMVRLKSLKGSRKEFVNSLANGIVLAGAIEVF
ncbi:MAG: nucleotidyltransferase domain-containing protein [Candidatus Aenigmarchaeota archaeon]|nr:nucleotidyltransferase domain-containing protein [Candidatus Aenigmarchaeota archaeon]